jgi:hypothetical protein
MMAAAQVIPFPSGSLYEITDHLSALLESVDGIEDPELRKQCEAEITAYMDAEVRKVDGVASYLAYCEAQAKFAAEEARRLAERRALFENRAERVKQYAIAVMESLGKKKLEGRTATLSLRQCPPSLEILNERQIPDVYKVTQTIVSVDKRAIKAALEKGEDVPGADLRFGRNTLVRR